MKSYQLLYNAHGDVVATTGTNGAVKRRYDYDAFGNEKGADTSSSGSSGESSEEGNVLGGGINPFRYCGEYWDKESGTYYLRARYYAPSIGRFTQQDTHWNTANMIYGDNPQKINEREDKLGLTAYTMVPQITAVMQAGNLYVYANNNAVLYRDETGKFLGWAVGALVGAVCGAVSAAISGDNVLAGALGGAASGAITGAVADFVFITGGTGAAVVAWYAAAGAAGALADNLVQYAITGDAKIDEILVDVVLGAACGALGGLSEGAVQSLASVAKQKGRDVMKHAYNMLKKEIKELPIAIATEFISNINNYLIALGYDIGVINIRSLFAE